MPYKNQAIIGILTGSDAYDGPVKRNIEKLKMKWTELHPGNDNYHIALLKKADIVPKPEWNDPEFAKLKDILPNVNNYWRLYIVGHGDWKQTTCGGVQGQAMAQLLIDGGLRQVYLISVTACGGAATSSYGGSSSFAYHLHYFLGIGLTLSGKVQPKVRTRVHGRLSVVGVGEKGIKVTLPEEDFKKYGEYLRDKSQQTNVEEREWNWVHKRSDSKIVYLWKGDKQEKRVVDYAHDFSSRSKLEAALEAQLNKFRAQQGQQALDDYLRQRGFIYDPIAREILLLQ